MARKGLTPSSSNLRKLELRSQPHQSPSLINLTQILNLFILKCIIAQLKYSTTVDTVNKRENFTVRKMFHLTTYFIMFSFLITHLFGHAVNFTFMVLNLPELVCFYVFCFRISQLCIISSGMKKDKADHMKHANSYQSKLDIIQ